MTDATTTTKSTDIPQHAITGALGDNRDEALENIKLASAAVQRALTLASVLVEGGCVALNATEGLRKAAGLLDQADATLCDVSAYL